MSLQQMPSKCVSCEKALRVCVLRNGDGYFGGVIMAINTNKCSSFEKLLDLVTSQLMGHVPLKTAIRKLFRTVGTPITALEDLVDGDILVGCCQYETFVRLNYKVNKMMVLKKCSKEHLPQCEELLPLQQITPEDLPKSIQLYLQVTDVISKQSNSIIFNALGRWNPAKRYVVKVIDKPSIESEMHAPHTELEVLRQLQQHDHIVNLKYTVERHRFNYIVMERLSCDLGIFLRQYLKLRKDWIKWIMQDAGSGLEYLHARHIIHRDIKMENLLVQLQLEIKRKILVKISDFGLAIVYKGQPLKTVCGSPHFVAPEMVKLSGYDFLVDCWSLGVVLYYMLYQRMPYGHNMRSQLGILKETLKTQHNLPHDVTSSGDLVNKLLQRCPEQRLTAAQLRQHVFLQET